MAKASGKLRLYAPSLVTLAVLLPFFAYYIRQVKDQEGYLNSHAFRVLEAAAGQFAVQLKGARDTMVAAIAVRNEWPQRKPLHAENEKRRITPEPPSEEEASQEQAREYLRTFLVDLADRRDPIQYKEKVPDLDAGDTFELAGREGISPATIKLEVRRPKEDAAGEKVTGKDTDKPPKPPSYRILAFLDPALMLHRAVGSASAGVFETVLLATNEGVVIAQTANLTANVRDIEALLAGRKTKRTVEESAPSKEPTASPYSGDAVKTATRLAGAEEKVVVEVAGEDYFLFSIPVAVSLEIQESSDTTKHAPLVLYGLARKEAWEARAMRLPSLGVPALVLLLIMGMTLIWPVLLLQTMSPSERLRRRTVSLMAASSLLAAVLLSAMFLIAGLAFRLDQEKNAQLKVMSNQVQAHFVWEIVEAIRTSRLVIDHLTLTATQTDPPKRGFALLNTVLKAAKQNSPTLHRALLKYPYFAHIILTSGRDGDTPPNPFGEERQIIKLSADPVPTPLIPLPRSRFPFVGRLLSRRHATLHHIYPGAVDHSHRFTLESIVSPNTGEFLPVLMFYPKDGKKSDNNNAVNNQEYRVLITTKLPSLVNVLLPRGFGFAVVNDEGLVLFHSDSSRNLRENFYSECNSSTEIREAVVKRSARLLPLIYGGRSVSTYVQPLAARDAGDRLEVPAISNLDVSLIVYYESEAKTSLYTSLGGNFLFWALVVPGLLILLIQLAIQFNQTLSPSSRADYFSKRPWPSLSAKPVYILEGLWGISWFLVAFAAWICWPAGGEGGDLPVAGWALLLPLIVSLLAGCGGLIWSSRQPAPIGSRFEWPWLKHWKERIPLSAAYSLRLFSWALAVIGPLSLIVFQLVLLNRRDIERRADRNAATMAVEARKDRNLRTWISSSEAVDSACQAGEEGGCQADAQFRKARTLGAGYFDVYDPAACPREEHNRSSGVATEAAARHSGITAAGPCGPSPPRSWWQRLLSVSEVKEFNRRGVWLYLLVLIGIALLFLWKHFLIRRLFILDFQPPKPLPGISSDQLGEDMREALTKHSPALRRVLIFADPRSGTGAALKQMLEKLRDPANPSLISPQFAPLDCPSLLGGRPEDDGGWRKKLIDKHASCPLTILDNFATGLITEADRKEKLAMLEKMVFTRKAHVYVFTSIDPLLVIRSLAGQRPADYALRQEADRWARLLSSFERRVFDTEQAVPDMACAVAKLHNRCLSADPAIDPKLCDEYRAMFEFELNPTNFLRRCAAKVKLEELDLTTPRHFEQSLVSQVRALTEGYYRVVWLNCTGDERLALFQLAKDGWMNPLNKVGIAHVIQKKLVVRASRATAGAKDDGAYRLINESFRQFVLDAVEEREAAEWAAAQSQSLWPSMRMALMLAVGLLILFVAYTQRDLFDVYFSYFAALAGGSAALLRIVMQLFSKDESKLAAVLGGAKAEKAG